MDLIFQKVGKVVINNLYFNCDDTLTLPFVEQNR
jgi:hypothetical protein